MDDFARDEARTRALREEAVQRLERFEESRTRYYRNDNPLEWPTLVGISFRDAERSVAKGDEEFLLAQRDRDPKGLREARRRYHLARNDLFRATYYAFAWALPGLLRGVSPLETLEKVHELADQAELIMEQSREARGWLLTAHFFQAADLMRRAVWLARKGS